MGRLTAVDLSVKVAGRVLPVAFTEELSDVADWISTRGTIGFDVETRGGVDLYGPDFDVRVLSLSDLESAIVIPVERYDAHDRRRLGDLLVRHARARGLVGHNAHEFDLPALDVAGVITLEDFSPHDVRDTRSQSYLLDPRPRGVGNAIGHALKALSDEWIDPAASSRGQALLAEIFQSNGWSTEEGFSNIPIDDPTFVTYAGLDSFLSLRLSQIFEPHLVERDLRTLERFDAEVSLVCARMRKVGLLVDLDYIEHDLIPYLTKREAEGRRRALDFGIENVHSTAQVARALSALGWEPTEFTDTGKPKVDRAVLSALVADGHPLAEAVMLAKQSSKFLSAYAQNLLDFADADGRVHPEIRSTGAVSGRMSVARPAVQQMPSNGPEAWRLRRPFLAGPGLVFGSTDLEQVELRILGGLAGERSLIEAITAGEDPYSTIAEELFGPDFTASDRKLGKMVSLARVFGGGASTIARNGGISVDQAADVIRRYDSRFPRIRSYSRRLQDRASLSREITTVTGRRIPEEADSIYRCTNHHIQSVASDWIKSSLLRLVESGFEPGHDIALVIHDEILWTSTPERFEDRALTVRSCMEGTFEEMPISTDTTFVGPDWSGPYRPDTGGNS